MFIEWDSTKRKDGPPLEHRVKSDHLKSMLEARNIKNIKIRNIDCNSYLISGLKV